MGNDCFGLKPDNRRVRDKQLFILGSAFDTQIKAISGNIPTNLEMVATRLL